MRNLTPSYLILGGGGGDYVCVVGLGGEEVPILG